MPHDRFYIDSPLDGEVTLTGDEFTHLSRIMRKKEGDTVELVNGKHLLAVGTILNLGKREAVITITEVTEKTPLLPPLILAQAFPKLSHLELILQKGTELGVSAFHIFPSKLSEKKAPTENQKRRLHLILISAIKQCGRLDLPTLSWDLPKLEGNCYFGDLSSSAKPLREVATLPATLIIGPEKGFTPDETEAFRQKATGVRLAPYTLRTETAAIAGVSVLVNNLF